MNIFIAGCGRSGTSLIRDLMKAYDDTDVIIDEPNGESSFLRFADIPHLKTNVVIKRKGDSWKTLSTLPSDIGLIYCIRHPFDSLTSTHPLTRHLRKFHITPERWMSEYKALQALKIHQPERKIFFLRYEDLVKEPDHTQKRISEYFGLIPTSLFTQNSENIEIFSSSIKKWNNNFEYQAYLQSIPDHCKALMRNFCQEFEYSISEEYFSHIQYPDFQYRFSVIIPLEFHRGQIEECLKRWIHGQTYPSHQYEVLAVGCRFSLNEEMISYIENELRSQDKLLLYDEPHDIALCYHAAHEAKGEILLFTESHCLPDTNTLSLADEKLNSNPEWAGFSGNASRIITNRLSIVEADMYQGDIRFGLIDHPWRKVLDQIFVIRNIEYQIAGGLVPDLGHFAEWHLAARLHEKELLVEFNSKVNVSHFYSGNMPEIIEFTADFTHGEMKYKAEYTNDPCQEYFPASNEWMSRFSWLPRMAQRANLLAWKSLSKSKPNHLNSTEIRTRIRLLMTWYVRASYGIKLTVFAAFLRFQIAYMLLRAKNFLSFGKDNLRTAFLWLVDSTILLERIKFIENWLTQTRELSANFTPQKSADWQPEAHLDMFTSVGFHPLEHWEGKQFRWSDAVAIIEIYLEAGDYEFRMEWLPIKLINNLAIYVDGKPIPSSQKENAVSGQFSLTATGPLQFAWTCEPWTVPNDSRILGIPVKSISWLPQTVHVL